MHFCVEWTLQCNELKLVTSFCDIYQSTHFVLKILSYNFECSLNLKKKCILNVQKLSYELNRTKQPNKLHV